MHAATNSISPETFLAIMAAAALAGTLASFAGRAGLVLPVVVLELLAGIALGPHVAGFTVSSAVLLFKNLGLGLLFFFAGYELDLRRIAGRPLRLGPRVGRVVVARLRRGGGAPLGGDRGIGPVYRLGPRDHRDRHPDPGPVRHRRAEHPVRHLPAGGRSLCRVRTDPAADARPVNPELAAQRADPAGIRRGGGRRRRMYDRLARANAPMAGTHPRGQLPAPSSPCAGYWC